MFQESYAVEVDISYIEWKVLILISGILSIPWNLNILKRCEVEEMWGRRGKLVVVLSVTSFRALALRLESTEMTNSSLIRTVALDLVKIF